MNEWKHKIDDEMLSKQFGQFENGMWYRLRAHILNDWNAHCAIGQSVPLSKRITLIIVQWVNHIKGTHKFHANVLFCRGNWPPNVYLIPNNLIEKQIA